ncbi:GTP pyrophosphokinase [Brevibacterium casei]|uniref:GTP pyrophosphokinase n=1 Tax=Brevibacterium casei TaxID=33889 RepID=UPI0028AC5EA3|nr:RelA/SpoT domain-containing protein [Brevibacterium casei]
MAEAEALAEWQRDKAIYAAWGDLLTSQIIDALKSQIHEPIDQFLKIPPKPRVKLEESLRVKIQRKIRDGKPIDTIDDRVGVRFVVLLTEQIKQVEAAIARLGHTFTKDRDYESERNARPLEFAYQSVHLVVRPTEPLQCGEIMIPKGLACEVQIRTLLQHAHSELTHDRLYKARSLPPHSLNRSVARSMALIEATDNIFSEVSEELEVTESELRQLVEHLDQLYEELFNEPPIEPRYSAHIVGDLLQCGVVDSKQKVTALFKEEKTYLVERIRERRDAGDVLAKTSAVLMAYLCVVESSDITAAYWPASGQELTDIGVDLGMSLS